MTFLLCPTDQRRELAALHVASRCTYRKRNASRAAKP
jgi:hypothetical protein